jgi:hypothetical protein
MMKIGIPFLEDLTARFPSTKLRVELRGGGGELPIEAVYSQFRVYGRLHDILVTPAAKGTDLGVITMLVSSFFVFLPFYSH